MPTPPPTVRFSDSREHPMFVPASVDDLGLDVYAFRIYARACRRAGTQGALYESVANLAAGCGMSERRARSALRDLEKRRMLRRGDPTRMGSYTYALTSEREWTPAPGAALPRHQVPPPPAPGAAKGTPTKAIPEKVVPTPTPPKDKTEVIDLPPGIDRDAWGDYERHRREKRSALTPTARSRLLAKLAKATPAAANEALRRSVENGWTGVFLDRVGDARPATATEYRDDVTSDDLLGGPLDGRR